MNPDQQGPYGPRHVPPPPLPAFAVPPRKQRGKGCLYAAIGGFATLFLMVSCGVIVSSASDPSATSTEPPAASEPAASGSRR